jgi:hypothetical protein
MHFTKAVPSVFYADIRTGLKTFVECLEFTIGHDELHTATPFYVVNKGDLSIMIFHDKEQAAHDHP